LGVFHGNSGKVPHNKTPIEVELKIIDLLKNRYRNFNVTGQRKGIIYYFLLFLLTPIFLEFLCSLVFIIMFIALWSALVYRVIIVLFLDSWHLVLKDFPHSTWSFLEG